MNRENAQRSHDHLDNNINRIDEATIKSSETALRAAILINGGAAVSLLAFLGALASQKIYKIGDLKDTINSLGIFAYGVGFAASGIALSYITHYLSVGFLTSKVKTYEPPFVSEGEASQRWLWGKNIFHVLALLAGLGSLCFFVSGISSVKFALTQLRVSDVPSENQTTSGHLTPDSPNESTK